MEIKLNTETATAEDIKMLQAFLEIRGSRQLGESVTPRAAAKPEREDGVGRRLQKARKEAAEVPAEPEPPKDVEEDVEDVEADVDDEAGDDFTVENALELAQGMLRNGERAKVVAALKVAGVKKVTDLKTVKQLQAFQAEVSS